MIKFRSLDLRKFFEKEYNWYFFEMCVLIYCVFIIFKEFEIWCRG